MVDTKANSCTPSISIKICNIKSIQFINLIKMAQNLVFDYLDHSKRHFCDFQVIQHGRYNGQIMQTIYFYQHMHYQVNLMHQTQENGQKSHFWLFGSFKKAFLRFLNDPAWVIGWQNHAHHLVLSKYAIQSHPNGPKRRYRPKSDWIIQKYKIAIIEWSRFFLEKRPCTFLSLIVRNIHAKFGQNP